MSGVPDKTLASKGARVYMYTETSDKSVGILTFATRFSGSPVFERDTDLQQRAAILLGIGTSPRQGVVIAQSSKLELPPGSKLFENREAGTYLWEKDGENEAVDVRTRIPGWRFMLERPARLRQRGSSRTREKETHAFWDDYLSIDTAFVIVAQVLCPGARSDGSIIVGKLRDPRLFAIACWSPSILYSKYEALFERVLSEFRIYGFKNPKDSADS
jgi:hypothetical protein